jgi:hypothetical protein
MVRALSFMFALFVSALALLAATALEATHDDPAPLPPDQATSTTASNDEPTRPRTLPLTPAQEALRNKIRKALAIYHRRPVNTRDHNPWEVFHWIVGYGTDATLLQGGPGGQEVNAIGYLNYDGNCRGGSLLFVDRDLPSAEKGPGVQGHFGQYLAILAQSYVRPEYPIRVQGRDFTVADLIEQEKRTCQTGTELTFKLIALTHYLPSDATWKCDRGQTWNIDRLIREELAAPIRGAACGGTHRLMGLSFAYKKREKRGEPITGESLRAQKYIRDYHKYTYSMQNRDGSFSTEWFNRGGSRQDLERRLQTTGHILEWLAYSSNDNELDDPRLVRAVDYLSGILIDHRNSQKWEIGHLGHAVHGLALYDQRRFAGSVPGGEMGPVADGEASEEPLTSWRDLRRERRDSLSALEGEVGCGEESFGPPLDVPPPEGDDAFGAFPANEVNETAEIAGPRLR